MNAVANTNGKGRDDFALDVLTKSEDIVLKASNRKKSGKLSKALITVASRVCQTYEQTRQLLKKFGQNIEALDPQLKNNAELVSTLEKLEESWSLAFN